MPVPTERWQRGIPQVARECGIGPATIYTWKAKFGGLEVSEAQRLRVLEDQNSRLKRLVREECLRGSWFTNLFDTRRKLATWHNEQRPHSSLGYRPPAEFARLALTESCGKDVRSAHLQNACGVSHFAIAPEAGQIYRITCAELGAAHQPEDNQPQGSFAHNHEVAELGVNGYWRECRRGPRRPREISHSWG